LPSLSIPSQTSTASVSGPSEDSSSPSSSGAPVVLVPVVDPVLEPVLSSSDGVPVEASASDVEPSWSPVVDVLVDAVVSGSGAEPSDDVSSSSPIEVSLGSWKRGDDGGLHAAISSPIPANPPYRILLLRCAPRTSMPGAHRPTRGHP